MIIIKVIKNNFNQNNLNKKSEAKPKIIHIFCEHCDSELEITKEDTHIGWLGAEFAKCPCCGEETMVDELDGITLTRDNIEFPTHFNRTNKNLRNVLEISNEEIVNQIKRAIDYFRKNKDDYYWYTGCGDSFVIIFRYKNNKEYCVLVAKDFYETVIPFGTEDL